MSWAERPYFTDRTRSRICQKRIWNCAGASERHLEATGYAENRIYFKEKEEFPPTSGDRMIMKYYENEKLSEVCALHVRDLYEL